MIGGRYSLEEQIGVGGMATVWRATDQVLGRQVAIKRLSPHLASDPSASERFRREAQAAARLNHPGILVVHDAGEDEEGPFIAMELIAGETLAQRLAAGAIDVATAISIAHQVAAAVDHAHENGVIHRDIKPANLVIDPEGRVRLMDFGIAKSIDDPATITSTGEMVGTVSYLAPEILAGQPATTASDIYSLGAVVYEMICGKRPFAAPTTAELFEAIRQGDPPPLAGMAPAAVEAAILRALDKDPARRPLSASAFAHELVQQATLVMPSIPVTADRPTPDLADPDQPTLVTGMADAGPKAGDPSKPRRRMLVGAGLLGLALVGFLVAGDDSTSGDDATLLGPSTSTTTGSTTTTTTPPTTTTTAVPGSEPVTAALADIDAHLATLDAPTYKPRDVRKVDAEAEEAVADWADGKREDAADHLQEAFDTTLTFPDTDARETLVELLTVLAEAMGFDVKRSD